MCARVHLAKCPDVHFGVDGGGFKPGVAEELTDEADVGPVLEHVDGTGVAQEMAGALLFDPCGLDGARYPVADVVGAQTFSVAGEEQGAFADADFQLGPGAVQVTGDPLQAADSGRDDAVFAALALAHPEAAAPGVDVLQGLGPESGLGSVKHS